MFQLHTPGSKALPFTFKLMGAALWGGRIKNSLLVYYCIQNQNKLGEMSLNILKLLEKGFFRFCLQAELQMSQDQHVFRGICC